MAPHVVARSLTGRDWIEPPVDAELARALAQRLDLPEVVGRILAIRGIELDAAPAFLEPRLRTLMPDPSTLADVDVAAERLARAIRRRERIGVLSDYDVDGCTSAALVVRWARLLDSEPTVRIPDRIDDGYGPSVALIDALADAGCGLALVLDSGTTAFAPLAHAAARGLDVVVVDHHQAEAELPTAIAVVNPNRQDESGALAGLAAVGLTFLLLVATNRALRRQGHFATRTEPDLRAFLDLVALGTVADVVPLLGLNRAFVSQGLRVLAAGGNAGLAALAEVAGVRRPCRASSLAFALAPRLNAAGRLAHALPAMELLATADPGEATALAQRLDALNGRRRAVEQALLDDVATRLEAQVADGRRVLCAHGRDWHPGVLGIVAGRLAERFHRPVLLAGQVDDEAVGSGRAPEGYDLGAALRAAVAAGVARKAGGHARAGGFTVALAKLPSFHELVESTAAAPTVPRLSIDAAVATAGANNRLVDALARLEPYGERHPRPRLRVVGARIADLRVVGERHLGVRAAGHDGASLRAIAFRAVGTALETALARARDRPSLQLAGRLEPDGYRGHGHVQLQIDDVAEDA